MRKLICILLTFLLSVSFVPFSTFAESEISYCIKPLHTDITVAENHADEWLNVAGLTKLPAVLTLCLAFDKGLIRDDDTIQVSANAASIDGPTAFLKRGESIGAGALMRAAVMISAGDAIVALSEHAFGSEDVFLDNIYVTLRSVGIEKQLPNSLGTYMTFSCRELVALGEAAVESLTFLKYE